MWSTFPFTSQGSENQGVGGAKTKLLMHGIGFCVVVAIAQEATEYAVLCVKNGHVLVRNHLNAELHIGTLSSVDKWA